MALVPWIQDGKVVVNADGKPILCEDCPCTALECDECCDCQPATLSVVVSGSSTAADATWSVTNVGAPTLCKWEYKDAGDDISVVAQKSGETMSLVIKNFAEDETYFSGSQETDHKGACKRLDYTISNGAGSGSADVDGTCTPTCDSQPCAEPFDPPVDSPPCTPCCPSCIPDEVTIVISGVTLCTTNVCQSNFPDSFKITSITLNASSTLTRTGAGTCTWAGVVGTFTRHSYTGVTDCSGSHFESVHDLEAIVTGCEGSFTLFGPIKGGGFTVHGYPGSPGCYGVTIEGDYVLGTGGSVTITPC